MTNDGFFRVACASVKVTVADVESNCTALEAAMREAHAAGAAVAVLPELCVTAYTCADLFHSSLLIEAAAAGVRRLTRASAALPGCAFAIGTPLLHGGKLFNCAAVISEGRIRGYVPKTYLPDYNEFYERRWFASGLDLEDGAEVDGVPFGRHLLFKAGAATFGIEICEDLWVPRPPSIAMALGGADLILNLSASNDLIGKYGYLTELVCQQSARCICAYAYASAGFGESTTDLVFDSKLFVAENGRMLRSNHRGTWGQQCICADIDLEAIRRDRMHLNSFATCSASDPTAWTIVEAIDGEVNARTAPLMRQVDPHPFVPASDGRLRERCEEIVGIQAQGLAKRLDATGCRCLVIGISGGLDSTLALLVAVRTFDLLGIDRKGIKGVTMPGFGTTGRTHSNALELMALLGVDAMEVNISKAVTQHFADIGHDPAVTDVTYENSQARERTQILMDLANKFNGMVLGTGDLSELALGWATYNGDHMSMYGVNAGVPKTLVRHLVNYFADCVFDGDASRVLHDIADTPISPELTPAASDGSIAQKTEDLVGPYELHDFFLYYVLRYGFSPRRIFLLAQTAFAGAYSGEVIKKWLTVFFRRFFSQQFKRSCLPDGPKVGSVCLSPRGDWRMPSDASSRLWLAECEHIEVAAQGV